MNKMTIDINPEAGIFSVDWGEPVLTEVDGRLVVEMQKDGEPTGFEPSSGDVMRVYHDARRDGLIQGSEFVLNDLDRNTANFHKENLAAGLREIEVSQEDEESVLNVEVVPFEVLAIRALATPHGEKIKEAIAENKGSMELLAIIRKYAVRVFAGYED